ncbi:MAG: PAS domain S-box protein [Desulfobaccales bacterium]
MPSQSPAGRKQQMQGRAAVLAAIGRIFREALFCETEEQLGRVFLDAAAELTGSKFGFICGEDQTGKFQTIATSRQTSPAAAPAPPEVAPLRQNWEVQGIPGLVIRRGESLICNDPASHPDWLAPPADYPPVHSFLGVPLKQADQTFGMVGLSNRPGGYDKQHQEDMEAMAAAMAEVLMRQRAERKLTQLHRHHELILSSASEGILGLDSQGHMTFVNPAAAQMLGYEVEELLGRHAHTLWHHTKPDGSPYPPTECPILETLQGGARFPFEDDYLWRKDRTGFPVRCSRNPILQNGEVSGAVVTFRDISQRKKAEEALRQSEALYRQIVETALEGIWILDSKGRVTFANDRIMEMLGYSQDEMLGEPVSKFMDQEWLGKISTHIIEQLREGTKEHLDFKLRHKEGRELWAIMTSSPVFDQQGRYAGSLGMVTNITTRKRAEEALRENEQRFRDITEHAVEWIWEVDREGKYTYASPGVEKLLGYTPEEVLCKHFYDFFLPEDREKLKAAALAVVATKQPFRDFLNRNRRKNGEIVWLSTSGVPVLDAAGDLVGYRGTDNDITGRKQAEEALRQSEEMFRCTFDQSPIGAAIVGLDFRFQRVNTELGRITDYSEKELLARTFIDITHPEDTETSIKMAQRLAAGKIDHYTIEKRYLRKDGNTVWVRLSTRLIKDAAGKPLYFLPMFQDITAHKQADENLRQSLRQLQKVMEEIVQAMARTVEVRDPYTAGHQRRVTRLAMEIAQEMDLSQEQKNVVWIAGTLHDLGKIYVPAEILNRPGKLSDLEYAMIKTHSQKGFEILQDIDFPWPVAQIIKQHHERLDGSGYPDSLHDDEILLEARILAVADVVEAMASHRPYRPAQGIDAALEEISRNRGTQFDPQVVDACLKVFREKDFNFS